MSVHPLGYGCNCDICGKFLHSAAITEEFLRKDFAKHGWERADIDLCDDCVEKRAAGHEGTLLLIKRAREKKAAAMAEAQAGG